MEDISRELEKEIAQAKPKPYKQDRKSQVIIIDDFGKMKSGEYLKTLLTFLAVAGGIGIVAAALLFFLYSGLSKDSKLMKAKLETAEKKVQALTREKEVLMARLVIQGKEVALAGSEKKQEPPAVSQIEEKKPLVPKKSELSPQQTIADSESRQENPLPPVEKQTPVKQNSAGKNEPPKPVLTTNAEDNQQPPSEEASLQDESPVKKVAIEKFKVVKDGNNGDLLVRFDIRNVSSAPGDVNGRIFTLLKPDDAGEDQWLVIPSSKLENGMPVEHRKGQYFSIAHFKPVKFRIKNQASPDFFKKAAIYIFTTKGELMNERFIDISEAE